MERRRRWLALLLALVLAVGLLPTAALATGCNGEPECNAETHNEGCKGDKTELTRAKLAEMLYQGGEGPFANVNSASTESAGFTDIGESEENENGYDVNAINALANAKFISGTGVDQNGDLQFNPDDTVTRVDLAVILWKLTGSKQVDIAENLPFTDVFATDWYAPAVAAMYSAGVVNGVDEDTFGVDSEEYALTVGQMNALLSKFEGENPTVVEGPRAATRLEMLMKAYEQYKNSPLATVTANEIDYADIGTCTSEEQAAIQFFTTRSVVNGYKPEENGPNLFGPYDAVSNLQAAVFLYRCAIKFDPDSVTQGEQEETQSAQAVSYSLPIPETPENAPDIKAMVEAAWELFAEEMGEDAANKYKNSPDTAILADDVTALTTALVPAAPKISFENGQATITAEEGATIYYTTDGNEPTVKSEKYTSEPPISVTQGTTVKAVAVKNSLYSEVATYAVPKLTITPSSTSLTGGGTVTFTIENVPAGAEVSVACSNVEGIIPSQGADGAWSVTLPNASETYTFTATAGEGDDAVTAECTVMVTRRSSTNSGGSSNTTTTTERNPDGSTTTTTTNKTTGTVTETTRYPDGSQEAVETKKDGTVTTTSTDAGGNQTRVVENPDGSTETTVDNADGTSSVTTQDPDGRVTVEAVLPASAVNNAEGEAVALPMPAVRAEVDRNEAPAVTVDLPRGASVPVEIPVENAATSTVALLVRADGTEEIVKTSLTTENGVAVSLSDGDTVKIVDNGKTFYDVPGSHWGAEAIDFVTSRELFGGTSEAVFSPETAMSRGMLVTVLARLEGVDTAAGDPWYAAGRRWAVKNGVSDGTGMDQALTREQLAAMLWRYAGSPLLLSDLNGFVDADSVSAYAADAMAWAVEQGLIGGVGDQRLNPRGSATRAQVAAILQRYISLMNG